MICSSWHKQANNNIISVKPIASDCKMFALIGRNTFISMENKRNQRRSVMWLRSFFVCQQRPNPSYATVHLSISANIWQAGFLFIQNPMWGRVSRKLFHMQHFLSNPFSWLTTGRYLAWKMEVKTVKLFMTAFTFVLVVSYFMVACTHFPWPSSGLLLLLLGWK